MKPVQFVDLSQKESQGKLTVELTAKLAVDSFSPVGDYYKVTMLKKPLPPAA